VTSPASELILARLPALHPKSIDLSLGRVERLLAALGNPERHLPPVVHVAGTNGKGSTLAMLAAMLRADGQRVDRYISPHLVRFNERILQDDQPIGEDRLAECLQRCEAANNGAAITFFEITTAAAFLAFAEAPADWVLIETGLGGRLDATNVVARPRLCLITPVSMDHESFLGDTLAKIAFEKAGILKPGVPAVIGPQQPVALAVIEARAAEIAAPLLVHGRDWSVHGTATGITVEAGAHRLDLPRPRLEGVHQIDNAGLATMAALQLTEAGLTAPPIGRGLMQACWPGRLQRLTHGPLTALVPPGTTLWLDGGHNPAAGQVLAESLGTLTHGRALHLVVGMLTTKDLGQFLRPLAPLAASLRFVPVPGGSPSHDPKASAATAGQLGARAATADSFAAAVEAIVAEETQPYDILISGSLYLAGEVLRSHG
jgi:dihydrofolate synthase/folylpolyglutamate synthase